MQSKYCVVVLCLLSVFAMAQNPANGSTPHLAAKRPTPIRSDPGATLVAASIDGEPIYLSDVDASLGREGYLLQRQLYELRSQALKSLIQKKLLAREAKKKHLSEAALLERIVAKAAPVTNLDVTAEWANRVATLRPMGEIAAKYQITQTLMTRHSLETLDTYFDGMRREHDIQITITEPHLGLIADPSNALLGPTEAPITLTVFLDYQCPFSKRLDQQLTQLLSQDPFKSNVRVAIKHFPLPTHPHAASAAIAAVCAARQGKFASMHSRLFQFQQARYTEANLLQAVEQSAIDLGQFKDCLKSQGAEDQVSKDLAEGEINGVEATPTLFLNGQLLPSSDFSALRLQVLAAINGIDKPRAD